MHQLPQYTDKRGVGYSLHRQSDGSWGVWEITNNFTGWTWKGSLCSYALAMSFMNWLGDFEEAA